MFYFILFNRVKLLMSESAKTLEMIHADHHAGEQLLSIYLIWQYIFPNSDTFVRISLQILDPVLGQPHHADVVIRLLISIVALIHDPVRNPVHGPDLAAAPDQTTKIATMDNFVIHINISVL